MYKRIHGRKEWKSEKSYLLDEINVVHCTMSELSSTTWESEVFSRNFHPILVPFYNSQFCMRDIVVPYLQYRCHKEKRKMFPEKGNAVLHLGTAQL